MGTTLAADRAVYLGGVVLADSPPQCVAAVVTGLGAIAGAPPAHIVHAGEWAAAYPLWRDQIRLVVRAIEATPVTADPMHAARRTALRALLAYADAIDPAALAALTAAPEVSL
jgi:hypothetical protein